MNGGRRAGPPASSGYSGWSSSRWCQSVNRLSLLPEACIQNILPQARQLDSRRRPYLDDCRREVSRRGIDAQRARARFGRRGRSGSTRSLYAQGACWIYGRCIHNLKKDLSRESQVAMSTGRVSGSAANTAVVDHWVIAHLCGPEQSRSPGARSARRDAGEW